MKKMPSQQNIVRYYRALFYIVADVARIHGYAAGLHGSMQKDLDIMLVPWVHGASEANDLVDAIVEATHGVIKGPPTTEAHRRKCWKIQLLSEATGELSEDFYIDVSVFPLQYDHLSTQMWSLSEQVAKEAEQKFGTGKPDNA